MAEEKSFAQLYEEYQKTSSDDLFKQIENYLKKKETTNKVLQQIKNTFDSFTVPKNKYKNTKGEYKTTFSSLNKTERIEQILENIKTKPVESPPEGEPVSPSGGKGDKPTGDKPETPTGDKGEDPETVNKFIAEQVKLITNGKVLDGYENLNDFLKETKNDSVVLSKLIDAFKGISSKKDVKKSHKYASDYYIGVLKSRKEGKKQSTNYDALKYKQLKEEDEGGKGGKGGKGGTGSTGDPTGGIKDDPEKQKTKEILAEEYIETNLNDIQKRYDTEKLSKAQREELTQKLADNYFLPSNEKENIDNLFNQVVKGQKSQYKHGIISGIKKTLGGDDHTKTSQAEQDAIDKAMEKVVKPKLKSDDKPPPPETPKPKPPPPPKPVDPLPPIIQPSKIKVEDIQTDLDRYRQATKKLRNLIKGMNADGTQEKLKDFEYDTVRYRLLNGKPMTPEEQQHMNEIRDVKKQIEEYEEGAKKIAKEILEKERRTVQATKRTGLLGPHLANDTTKAVKEQLDKTPEQQIKDIDNWYIFDVPKDATGQGTKIDNPLVAQNIMREKMLLDGSTLFTSLSNYTLQEGPFERQDFFHQHPELTKAGIGRGMFEVKTEETKEEFLQKFNDGNNGLFSQDQTREEVSDFQNIYQKPARIIGGADYKLDFTNNRGIKHTDKVWLSNLNLFFDNAPIL